VIGHDRHATTDQLASLTAGALRPRTAARISIHVSRCDQCTQVVHQLDQVPIILTSAQYPPMPTVVSIQIEAALRVEATQRLSAMPATEGGRGDLPARHRRRAARGGWHLPGFSVPATRLVAAAGALVIAAAGSYAIVNHVHSGVATVPSQGSVAAPPNVQQMRSGPDVTYGRPGALHTIHAVQSSANFVPAKLTTQVSVAVHAAQARRVSTSQPTVSNPGASRAQGTSTSAGSATPSSSIASRLAGCIDLIAPGRVVLLVDLARYNDEPAAIIVIAALGASPAEAWAVGSACSGSARDVLGHAVLSHI
jgi:hypothetical protein